MMQLMLDERDAAALVRELISRGRGYVPDWRPGKGMDQALLEAVARYLRSVLQRLNRAPEKNLLAFLDMLGIRPVPPQSARAPVVFQLAENASNATIPAGTRLASPPPPGSNKQILFETEQSLGLAVAKLTQVFSLWPGRDQYIDHSELVASGKKFRAFEMRQLQDTPHSIYLAHDTLLALAGKSVLDVTFELKTRSSEHLAVLWEYWDGQVWREFRNMTPECSEEIPSLDSTNGLQRSGRYRLLTDCAETRKTTVNGMEAFWIRGKLNEPLPPNPLQILPDVDSIKLSTEIVRPLEFSWILKRESIDGREHVVQVIDETGTPLFGIKVTFEKSAEQREEFTNLLGTARSVLGERVTVSLGAKSKSANIPDTRKSRLTFAVAVDGLQPDKAFSDALDIDVSKPFYPFGQQPIPGSTFYFTNEELFNKPGASVDIYVQASSSSANQLETSRIEGALPLTHNVSWEYWNGKKWGVLKTFAGGKSKTDTSPDDFTGTGILKLPVPPDMEEVEVNGQKKKWMRVRLLSGGYGVQATINTGGTNFPFALPQPPLVSRMLIGYVWQNGPHHAEHVLTYNDFQYEDRTGEAKWPGPVFQPFSVVADTTPALYFGFDKKLPVDQIGVFLDIVEEHGATKGPPVFWEYWDGINWARLTANDETRAFRLPGIVSFIAAEDSALFNRFNKEPAHWVRARLKDDGPPGEPLFAGIYPNALWANQRETIVNQPVGASNGMPNQVFTIPQIPILPGEQIEVEELSGRRANVEWRFAVRELFKNPSAAIGDIEAMISNTLPDEEIVKDGIRLVRNRKNEITEVWVRWYSRSHLYFSGPEDRDLELDRTRGLLRFGDNRHGKVPPVGARIQATLYRIGGDSSGNVPAKAISQLLGAIAGIESVSNPKPAEGGANAESLSAFSNRAPETLRHRGRCVTARDYEMLAKEANAGVAFAHAIPGRNAAGIHLPGWVTLIIIPQTSESRPWPTWGLREQVQKFISERAEACISSGMRIHVTGPEYLEVSVQATIVAASISEAGAVESRSRDALKFFLHPIRGGPSRQGWQPGENVSLGDIAAVLEAVNGVEFVKDLALFVDGNLQGDHVEVGENRIAVAGEIRLKLEA